MKSTELLYNPTLEQRFPSPFYILRAFKCAFSPSILILSMAATLICYSLDLWSPAVHFTGKIPMSQESTEQTMNVQSEISNILPHLFLKFRPYFHTAGTAFYWQIAAAAVIWSFVGLAICRLCAVKLTSGDSHSIKRGITWALVKYPSWLGAVLISVACVSFFWCVVWCGLRIPYLNQWLFPVWYFALFLTILTGIGLSIAVHFISPALVTDNGDCFDALSRAFAYATQRPFHLIVYVLGVILVGNFGIAILVLVLNLFNAITLYCINQSGMEINAYIQYCMRIVWLLPMYVLNAFCFTSVETIYLLLRFQVDKVELDEVWLDTPYGLPRHTLPSVKLDSTQK